MKTQKESFVTRLSCNLLGAGSAIGIVLLVLQLWFGIFNFGSHIRRPPTPPPQGPSMVNIHGAELYKGFFKEMGRVIEYSVVREFKPMVALRGQICYPTPKPFDHVYAALQFVPYSRNGTLIWFRFLGLKVYLKDLLICVGRKVPYCAPTVLTLNRVNALKIGVQDNHNGTKTVYLLVNSQASQITLSLSRRSFRRKTILGEAGRWSISMSELRITFTNRGKLKPVADFHCRPMLLNGVERNVAQRSTQTL